MSNASNEEAKRFSKECIVTSVLELIKEKDYEKITLSEIAERAGVSRNAIYRNYKSKDMILKSYINGITLDFIDSLKKTKIKCYNEYVSILFNHLCKQKEIAKALIEAGLTRTLLGSFMLIKGHFEAENNIKEYYENYRIGGMFFVYITWLDNGCKESPAELIEIVNKVICTESIIPKI